MVSSAHRVQDGDDAKESSIDSVTFQRPSSVLKEQWSDLMNAIRALSGADSTPAQVVNPKQNSYLADRADPRP